MDFYDKLIICVTLIAIVVILAFNTFCSAATTVPYEKLEDVRIKNDIIESGSGFIYSFPVEKGRKYKLNYVISEPTGSNIKAYTSDSPEIGSTVSEFSYIGTGYQFEVKEDYNYFLFYTDVDKSNVYLEDISETGFQSAIGSLVHTVSSNSVWSAFGNTISYILVVVIVSLGFYLILKMIRNLGKGKAKV